MRQLRRPGAPAVDPLLLVLDRVLRALQRPQVGSGRAGPHQGVRRVRDERGTRGQGGEADAVI